jgi:hypothetical protein
VTALQQRRVQYGSERSNYVAGLGRDVGTEPSIYLVAEIAAMADHLGGISIGLADRPYAAFFGVI